MSDCRRICERLASFCDGVLPAAEQADIRRHLEACPPCRVVAEREQGGRTVLRECATKLRAEALPPGFRTRCEALAREHCRRGYARPPLRAILVPVSVAAVLIVGTAFAIFSLATRQSDAVLAAQLALDHIKCFKVFDSPNSPGVDARGVEAMLASQYGWAMHVPPSSAADGVTLVGARRCVYADGTIPHVMYHVNGQDVSLYMLEGVRRQPVDVVTLGQRSHIWSRGDRTYVLVSSAAMSLAAAEHYVMQEAH